MTGDTIAVMIETEGATAAGERGEVSGTTNPEESKEESKEESRISTRHSESEQAIHITRRADQARSLTPIRQERKWRGSMKDSTAGMTIETGGGEKQRAQRSPPPQRCARRKAACRQAGCCECEYGSGYPRVPIRVLAVGSQSYTTVARRL